MKLNLSYIAGFFEGEGNAGFYGKHKKFSIELHQNNPDILYKIKDYFGCGAIYKNNKRNVYRWRAACNQGLMVVNQIYPYLQFRQEELLKTGAIK